MRFYKSVDSLKDYILVDQDQVRIEHYSRQSGGVWTVFEYTRPYDTLEAGWLGAAISLQRIYARVEFPAAQERP